MIQSVQQWGDNPAICLPLTLMQEAHLEVHQSVDIKVEHGRIVIEPVKRTRDLESLLSAITDDNIHREIDFGMPQGREML